VKCGLRADSVRARSACTPIVDRGVREPDGPCTALTAVPSFDAWTRWGVFRPGPDELDCSPDATGLFTSQTSVGPVGARWCRGGRDLWKRADVSCRMDRLARLRPYSSVAFPDASLTSRRSCSVCWPPPERHSAPPPLTPTPPERAGGPPPISTTPCEASTRSIT